MDYKLGGIPEENTVSTVYTLLFPKSSLHTISSENSPATLQIEKLPTTATSYNFKYISLQMPKQTNSNNKRHGASENVPNDYDELADHTEVGVDSDYDSDYEVRENKKFASGLDPNDGATKSIRRAVNEGRYCRKCAREFDKVAAYRAHMCSTKGHHVCQYCKNLKDYRSLKFLRFHYQRRHAELYCEYCRLEFGSTAGKRKHAEREHCVCDRCIIWFRSRSRRHSHWASSVSHQDTYCRPCRTDFADSAALESHCVATHNGHNAAKDKAQERENHGHQKTQAKPSKRWGCS